MRSELRRAGHLRQVAVEPLGAEATAALLDRTLGAAAPSLRRAVFDRTDGVPFYVKELGCAELAGDLGEAITAWREVADGRRRDGDLLRLGEAQRRLAAALELQERWQEALASREQAAAAPP